MTRASTTGTWLRNIAQCESVCYLIVFLNQGDHPMLNSATMILCVAYGAGGTDSNFEHLKSMQWAQGTWRREWVAEANTAQAKEGDKLTKEWRFAWTANKNALHVVQLVTVNGKPAGQLDALFGWDKNSEQIKGAGFGTNGITGGGWTIQTGDSKFTVSSGGAEWVFTRKGENGLTVSNDGRSIEFARAEKNE